MNATATQSFDQSKQLKLTTEELNDLIINSIQDVKGKNVVMLDMRELYDSPVDYFIVCEGDSHVQVRAIAQNIISRLKYEAGTLPSNKEGIQNASWICLDYFYTTIHIFYKETREFYQLEDLWSDAKLIEYEDV